MDRGPTIFNQSRTICFMQSRTICKNRSHRNGKVEHLFCLQANLSFSTQPLRVLKMSYISTSEYKYFKRTVHFRGVEQYLLQGKCRASNNAKIFYKVDAAQYISMEINIMIFQVKYIATQPKQMADMLFLFTEIQNVLVTSVQF